MQAGRAHVRWKQLEEDAPAAVEDREHERKTFKATSPKKGLKTSFFYIFSAVFGTRDHVQSLLQALASNFPSKMPDLDAYVSRHDHFCRF